MCGKLVGHHPIAGWLRVACSYVKRRTGVRWDDKVGRKTTEMMQDILMRVTNEDPVREYGMLQARKRESCGAMQAVLQQALSWRLEMKLLRTVHGYRRKMTIII